jgi:hypothetical protein
MRLAPELSIDRTVTCADCQVRADKGGTTAKLAMMINVRMVTPSPKRLPWAALRSDTATPNAMLFFRAS